MGLVTELIGSIENLNDNIFGRFFKKNLEDYCQISSIVGDNIVTDKGDLITIIKLHGLNQEKIEKESNTQGIDTFTELSERIYDQLKNFFTKGYYDIDFVYLRDKYRTSDFLYSLQNRQLEQAKKMGGDIDFIVKERIAKLEKYVSFEEIYVVLKSNVFQFSSNKIEKQELIDFSKEMPIFKNTQNIIGVYEGLKNSHNSFVEVFLKNMENIGFILEKMSPNAGLNNIRSQICYSLHSEDYLFKSTNNKKNVIKEESKLNQDENDISNWLYQDIKSQLFPYGYFEKINESTLKIHDTYFKMIELDSPMDIPKTFNSFINTLNNNISFRVSFGIKGNALKGQQLKKMLATIFAWVPLTENKEIKDALEYYAIKAKDGFVPVKFNVNFAIFDKDLNTLNKNSTTLYQAINSWGSATGKIVTDEVYQSFFTTVAGLSQVTYGTSMIECMDDVLYSLPINRVSPPYKNNSMTDIIVRTDNGKAIPLQVMSKDNTSFGEIICAGSGKGKSVWLNCLNFNFIFKDKGGIKEVDSEIPLLSMLDIGFSSVGLYEILSKNIFKDKKDQFMCVNLQNIESHAINHFDTYLGSRFPTAKEKEGLSNFLMELFSAEREVDELAGMISEMINAIYLKLSDSKNPKSYETDIFLDVDNKLAQLNFSIKKATWWEVVDFLFENNEETLAYKAQSMAVPLLEDLASMIVKDNYFVSKYSNLSIGTENAIQYVTRKITEAINYYRLINHPTKFNTHNKRVVIIDLNSVTTISSNSRELKTNTIFYMLGRFASTRNFFINEELFSKDYQKYARNALYENYWREKSKIFKALPKRIVYEEMHRTNGVDTIKSQIIQDLREGRKWNMSISLVSQGIGDFLLGSDDEAKKYTLIELCETKYIFSAANPDILIKTLSLPFETKNILNNLVADGEGRSFLGIFDIENKGKITIKLTSTMSSPELWAFNTTVADYTFRNKIFEIYGYNKGMEILAENLKEGTTKKAFEKIKEKYKNRNETEVFLEFLEKKYGKGMNLEDTLLN